MCFEGGILLLVCGNFLLSLIRNVDCAALNQSYFRGERQPVRIRQTNNFSDRVTTIEGRRGVAPTKNQNICLVM